MNTRHYRKSSHGRNTPVDLDEVTRQVYSAIDGNNSLSVIAESAGVSIPVLWQAIAKLKRLSLIEEDADGTDPMGIQFANNVQKELTKAIGPMSNVVIQKVVKLMNFTWPHIPKEHAREFIYRLLVHIPYQGTREEFQTIMLNEL